MGFDLARVKRRTRPANELDANDLGIWTCRGDFTAVPTARSCAKRSRQSVRVPSRASKWIAAFVRKHDDFVRLARAKRYVRQDVPKLLGGHTNVESGLREALDDRIGECRLSRRPSGAGRAECCAGNLVRGQRIDSNESSGVIAYLRCDSVATLVDDVLALLRSPHFGLGRLRMRRNRCAGRFLTVLAVDFGARARVAVRFPRPGSVLPGSWIAGIGVGTTTIAA